MNPRGVGMNCPQCGTEMEKGFLSLTKPVIMDWVKGESRPETEKLGSITLLKYKLGPWYDYINALRCEKCKLVTFKY
jgi:hypothetical protein